MTYHLYNILVSLVNSILYFTGYCVIVRVQLLNFSVFWWNWIDFHISIKVYFVLYLMKFKYVPLPAQHFLMVNWDTCLVLPACFWDLEGPRVFRAGMCKSVSFHKKDLSIGHWTIFSKYFRYFTYLKCWQVFEFHQV